MICEWHGYDRSQAKMIKWTPSGEEPTAPPAAGFLGLAGTLRAGTLAEAYERHPAGARVRAAANGAIAIMRPALLPATAGTLRGGPATSTERLAPPARTISEDRRRTAAHEAGHAVVSHYLGVPVLGITLQDDVTGSCDLDGAALRRLDLEPHAAVNLSGWRAEIKAGCTPAWVPFDERCTGDSVNLRATLHQAGDGARYLRDRAIMRADDLLAKHWPAVLGVADALVERGHLSREEFLLLLK